MLRLEDRIKSHQFFFRAAKTAIEVYLHLHDKPLVDSESDANVNTENLTPSELKKLKNKQKKQQIKAQQEKDKQNQLEQKKKEISKQKTKDDGEAETVNEEELMPEKLEKVPLLNTNIFLLPFFQFFKRLKNIIHVSLKRSKANNNKTNDGLIRYIIWFCYLSCDNTLIRC